MFKKYINLHWWKTWKYQQTENILVFFCFFLLDFLEGGEGRGLSPQLIPVIPWLVETCNAPSMFNSIRTLKYIAMIVIIISLSTCYTYIGKNNQM